MKKNTNKDNAGVKIPPPLVYLTMMILGWGINKIYPMPIGVSGGLKYIGLGAVILSIISVIYMVFIFKKEKTHIEPWSTTHKIIDDGLYAFSRNSIYVLVSGIPIGLGLFTNNYWMLLSFIPAINIVYHTAVKKEECYLEQKFGKEYLDYKARVRRWV